MFKGFAHHPLSAVVVLTSYSNRGEGGGGRGLDSFSFVADLKCKSIKLKPESY